MNTALIYYHPNVCHICHLTKHRTTLKTCKNCGMVAYCTTSHQKVDWKRHKTFCRAVFAIIHDDCWKSELRSLNVKEARLCLRILVEKSLERSLDSAEFKMIYFHKSCYFCYSKRDLIECAKCLTFMVCQTHKEKVNHFTHECADFELSLNIHIYKCTINLPEYSFCEELTNVSDIKSFINKNIVNASTFDPVKCALVSDFLTRPLTVLYALTIIDFSFPENLLIHIVGADSFETETFISWNVLLQLLPVKTISLIFIGPDVSPLESSSGDISASSVAMLYHDYARSAGKPDVICSFNCGIVEVERGECLWQPSLGYLANCRVPVILTSYNVSEAIFDAAFLRDVNPKLVVRQMRNPFSSLAPIVELDSSGVYFINSILSVLT